MLTISNEIAPVKGLHPTEVDKRKLRKVQLRHQSWTQVLTDAVMEKIHRGVADPDQAWILGELIRYLEHPRSGAMEFEDMWPYWVGVRDAVGAGILRLSDKGPQDNVATRWDQLLRYASLRLGRELGTEVHVQVSRKEFADPTTRLNRLLEGLASQGRLDGALKTTDTVGPIQITADLRATQLLASVAIEAPREGRALTRVNWLVRQLKDAPSTARIEAHAAHARNGTAALLSEVRTNPAVLVDDPKRDLRSFTVTLAMKAGTKRGVGRGGFVSSVLELVDEFYASVVQNLHGWSAPAPQLRKPAPPEADGAEMSSTALSSQDGPAIDWQDAEGPAGVDRDPNEPVPSVATTKS